MIEKTLSHTQARQAYGYLAGVLSVARHYENLATRRLIPHGNFRDARAVFEFGCGTGHFAELLLASFLNDDARYEAVDVTPTMVSRTRERLARFGPRARVELSDGRPPDAEPAGAYDRFVSNYVLDLLGESDIRAVLAAAHRMLQPGGLLCLSSLAPATGFWSGRVMRLWEAIHRVRPGLVGGCRPIELRAFLDERAWEVKYSEVVSPAGVPLENVVAARRGG